MMDQTSYDSTAIWTWNSLFPKNEITSDICFENVLEIETDLWEITTMLSVLLETVSLELSVTSYIFPNLPEDSSKKLLSYYVCKPEHFT